MHAFITNRLLLVAILALAWAGPAQAQKKPAVVKKPGTSKPAAATKLDRSVKPAPGPAPKINLAKAEQWTLNNGLKVFFVQDKRLPRITYQLQLDYDPILEGQYAGYVSIAGDLIGQGTQSLTKDQLDDEVDFMGASLSTSANGVTAFGLSRYGQRIIELVGEVLTKPRLEEKDFELIRKRSLSSLAASKNDPATISRRVSNLLMYGQGHPYGEYSTEESIKRVTLDKCKEFYQTYFRPNVGYLAIVGNITSEQAHAWTTQYLGAWQSAPVPAASYKLPNPLSTNDIVVVDRPTAVQSVINICVPVSYSLADSAYVPARIMNDILGGGSSARLFNNLRERHGYTYGAYSNLSPSKYIGSFSANASVRTAVTDSSVREFLAEMHRVGTEAVADSELTLSKNGLSGSFINTLEFPQTISTFAINTVRYNLPADFYATYLKRVAAVKPSQILAQGQRYVKDKGSYVVIVGNAKEIAAKLGAFGKVRYLDEYGKMVEANPLRAAPAGITADVVLANYVKAIGGKEEIEKVKDVSITYTGELQEQPFTLDLYRKRPNKVTTVASLALSEIDRNATDGKASGRKGQQGVKQLAGKELENAVVRGLFFWETDPAAAKITGKVLGVEKLNDKDVIKVEFTYPSGDVWQEYFDATTFLRVRKQEARQTPNGSMTVTTDFGDYAPATGSKVLFPTSFTLPLGPMSLKLKSKGAAVNTKLDDSIFTVPQ